ncbi:isocitrate lyase [Actinobacteria bacterium YIM 96077]|uniref:Isocitrate lyase n=1 Tax=Phytoactinopolyspora halophila TaxID=1981511 RepID=A0A329QF75_9ACTN|nr:isocitrate lyase [Phytoactinopolyspora halophila]AYY14047.1 isocitrate lyase [Actinobacteria bacterium YIM 96077]RAW10954.1 isocitrate lyase [Phytoactinopolyspora halophila]
MTVALDRDDGGTARTPRGTRANDAGHDAGGATVPERIADEAARLEREWASNPRWRGVERAYTAEDVVRLRGTVREEYTLARRGAERLWELLNSRDYVHALGAITGNQAVQMVRAGLEAIYLSGWQVAADGNTAGQTYPDQSLYPVNSVPTVVRRINNALLRADEITFSEGVDPGVDWLAPIVADAEAGFGGPLNAFELAKALIAAGAAGVHYEDQLASEKKCGHLGGKVLVPTSQHVRTLNAARLAADVADVPTIIIARTDALAAKLLTSDVDPRDREFLTGERSAEGYFRVTPGPDAVIARALAYAPYADLVWVETGTPDLELARKVAEAVHERYPDTMLAYNCSPSFNWKAHLDDDTIARFQRELGAMGYRFQFITLAGFHQLNYGMFELARRYATSGMTAYVELQEKEFAAEEYGYTGVKHQREVGTGYFDMVSTALNPAGETVALRGSTESEQFR